MSTHVEVVRFSDLAPEPVEWVWPGYLPAGMISLLDGDPGLGKSTLTLDLAARISKGDQMPDGSGGGEPRGVILLSAEDDRRRTIRPRLDAAGADARRVITFDLSESDGSRRPPSITPDDLARLERMIREEDAALVVFDPLAAYLPDGLDTNRDTNVRRVLYWLTKLTAKTGCAALALRHFRKSPSENPQHRGGGSIAFIATARAAYILEVDPDEPGGNRRVLAPSKMNVGPLPPSLAFRLAVEGLAGYPRIVWEGPSQHTARSLSALPASTKEASPRQTAEVFLSEELRDGPLATAEVFRRAEEAGIARRTLVRAKETLGVVSAKTGRPGDPGQWLWCLPKDANLARRMPAPGSGTLPDGLALFGGGDLA